MNHWGFTGGVDEFVAEVGSTFYGEIHRDPTTEKDRVRSLQLRLIVEVSGRGDTFTDTVSGVDIAVADDGSVASRFELPVPFDRPISYDGRLMSVEWRVEARIDRRLARDETFTEAVLVVPQGGFGLYDEPHPLR